MKLYLSSFRVGDRSAELAEMCSGRRIGLIPNAMDDVAPEPRAVSNDKAIKELVDLEIDVEVLDLRDYFGDRPRLEAILANLGGVWVRGGNTFVLRQAMKLSGFDGLLAERVGTDFFYGGYSAGICVLAPSLVGLGLVDDPQATPYADSEVTWEGLGLLDYLILPHYKSDHWESATIDKEVEFCTRKGIPFRTLRDGEVLVLELPADSALNRP